MKGKVEYISMKTRVDVLVEAKRCVSSSPRSWSCPDTSWRTCPRPWWWCGGSWGTGHGGRALPGSGWSDAARSQRSRCTVGSYYWRCAALSPPPGAGHEQGKVWKSKRFHFRSVTSTLIYIYIRIVLTFFFITKPPNCLLNVGKCWEFVFTMSLCPCDIIQPQNSL